MQDSHDLDNLLSTKKAASLLGVHTDTLKGLVRLGKLDALKLPSGHYRFRESDIRRFIAGENKQ